MNNLLDRLAKVPLAQKIIAAAVLMAALSGANYFFLVDDLNGKIKVSQDKKRNLNEQLVKKRVIADNLNQYRRDKEVLERRLAEALTELPPKADIDELLRQLNDVGKKSGLEIVGLEPMPESPQNFYASIPIKMQAAGNYHEIAVFFESVSKLRRIVNISGLTFEAPTRKNEKVVLKASYMATTFRFLEASEQKPAQQPKKK
ncbi:MAG: type 4a pilus biogenesis protein PilO [Deltaproteobacteria bacterium]|nr:type 4a pilus biogenesis protein PilO [Deltaproteobacteria bacterium]